METLHDNSLSFLPKKHINMSSVYLLMQLLPAAEAIS